MSKRKTIVLVVLFFIQLNVSVFAQNINLTGKGITLTQVFKEIKRQSNYDFFYNESLIRAGKPIDLDMHNATIREVLDYVLKDQLLQYSIYNKTIVIQQKNSNEKLQEGVQGRIIDHNGNPMAGVTVRDKNNPKNVSTTDANGYFLMYLNGQNRSLTCSCVGFETLSVTLQDGSWVQVKMKPSENMLDDIVVTGYQKLEKRSLTGSVTTLDMKQLKTIFQPNIDKLLQGQVPGLTVISTSGAPGAIPQIRIRGTAALSGNVQPLWVVDGVILDDAINVSVDDIRTNRNLIASGIGGINVEDIESINVLKDAAATAIYGTKAANGVIVITSKKGTAGKTTINFSSTLSMGERPQLSDAYMMNSKERIAVNMEMIERGLFTVTSSKPGEYLTATDFEKYFVDLQDKKITWSEFDSKVKELEAVNTDWFKLLFRNPVSQRYNFSINGGNEKTTFFASGSYNNEQATAKGVGLKTYTGTLRAYTFFTPKMRLGVTMAINARNNNSFFAIDSRENPYEWAIYTTRAQRVYDENGAYNAFYLDELKYNFIENRDKGWRNSANFGLRSTVDFEWKFFKDLTFTSLFNYSRQNTNDTDIALDDSYFVRSRKKYISEWKDGGYRKGANYKNGSITIRNQLVYNPLFQEKHYLNIMLGQEINKSKYEGETNQIYGYKHDQGHQQVPQLELIKNMGIPYWNENLSEGVALSYFGTANYTFDNRYTASLTARTDGSNRFGLKTNQLFQPLWSIGANYQMKQEKFFQDLDWLSYLTLKGSYGSQGNVASQAYSDLVTSIGIIDVDNPVNTLIIDAPTNPYLKWEKTYTGNAGLEIGLWKRRLMASVEYYNKKGTDLLGIRQVSQVTGFNEIQVNWASMRNRGWEFFVNSINIDTEHFRWSTTVNYGLNKNEVLEVESAPTVNTLTRANRSQYAASAVVGKPLDGIWSYRYAGLNTDGRATFYTEKEGEKVLYGMKNIDGLKYEGPSLPTTQIGFTNTFSYKRFTLSGLFLGSFGNVIRLRNLSSGYGLSFPDATQNMSKEWVQRWRKSGDESTTDIPKLENSTFQSEVIGERPYNAAMYDASDLRTVKGDFIRCQNLSLSYDYFTPKLRSVGIQNIRLMLQGNNLYVWKNNKLKGQDPEASGSTKRYSESNSPEVAFENTFLPIPRSYTASLQVQF